MAALGFVVVVAYAVVGAFQILVWNPLAAVPGMALADIYSAVDRAKESLAIPRVLVWTVVGIALGAAVLVAALRRPLSVRTVLALELLVLILGAPSHWMASFPAGMGLADTFAISGGDYSPWGKLLYAVSGIALLCLLVIMIRKGGEARGTKGGSGLAAG
ncbi:hypothetical protein ACIPY3_13675 [Paenarthrobacter sp. NPDC089714]|uniref:hypothetical protein n=1 Tax=Paenarthrobacter sp. NPDC089714 TaxID=3364377 RepID=UPI0037F765DB